jgi:hypothetical protein
MENTEKFKALFPMEVEVTQDIIDEADIGDSKHCIGALALNKGLGKEGLSLLHKGYGSWANCVGCQVLFNDEYAMLFSYDEKGERVMMMDVEKPFTVTFKVKQ